jgi:SAM-dependent methyltransferase
MSDRWLAFAREATSGGRFAAAYESWSFAAPLLQAIRDAVPRSGRILDIGCGNGLHAVLLDAWGYDVVAVDNDPAIVEEAERTRDLFDGRFELREADAFDLTRFHGRFDLVYSLGVVEHFEPDTTIELLREQARVAPRVLAAIPTRAARHAVAQTDERNHSPRSLRRLFRQAGLDVERTLVFGDVPTRIGRALRLGLPHAGYRVLQTATGYGLELACQGVRRGSGGVAARMRCDPPGWTGPGRKTVA